MRSKVLMSLLVTSSVTAAAVASVSAQDGRGEAFLNPLHALDSTRLRNVIEMPLFDPSRRLPPVVVTPVVTHEVAASPHPLPPAIKLLGTVQGKRDVAIVQMTGSTKSLSYATGDEIEGWRVTVLPSIGLRLTRGGETQDYKLFVPVGPSRGVTSSAPASSSQASSGSKQVADTIGRD